MLPHHRTRQATPQPPRTSQSLHCDAHEGDPEPQGALEGAARRPADQEALPDRGRREGLPPLRPQPIHQEGRGGEAEEDHRREGGHAPQEERGRGGGRGSRRVLHQGVEHTPSIGQQERVLGPGCQGGPARPGLRSGLQAPRILRPPADTPSYQRAGPGEREREEARPDAGREDQGGPPESGGEAQKHDRRQPVQTGMENRFLWKR